MDMAPEELGVSDAAESIRRGELSAERYAERLLELGAAGRSLNAFISQDPGQVLAAARSADDRRRAGSVLGPLHGVPLALKDNLDTAELPTSGGTPSLRLNRPRRNAAVAQRLIDAGAIVLGKTNLHELAFGATNNNAAFGPARNPYDPSRISGGSSGGTAVAVAAHLAPGGIGTDTGGSVRVPAALCGIVGFRPTHGRWPRDGIIPISPTRDTAGPMTRCVADAALLDAVVTGEPPARSRASLEGLRLGVPRTYFWDEVEPAVGSASAALLRQLESAGAVLVEGEVRDVGVLDRAAGFPIALHEAVAELNRYLAEHETGLDLQQVVEQVASPDVRALLTGALGEDHVPDVVYREALLVHRPALQRAYSNFFIELNVEAAIFPTTPLVAAPIGADDFCLLNGRGVSTFLTYTRNTAPGSLAGIPGISLPAALSPDGLPIGIALDGPAGEDQRLLALAAAIEELLPRLGPGLKALA